MATPYKRTVGFLLTGAICGFILSYTLQKCTVTRDSGARSELVHRIEYRQKILKGMASEARRMARRLRPYGSDSTVILPDSAKLLLREGHFIFLRWDRSASELIELGESDSALFQSKTVSGELF